MKLPYMQFFPADWVRDTCVLSLEAQGAWMKLICMMWESPTRGQLQFDKAVYAKMLGVSFGDATRILNEIIMSRIADTKQDSDGILTITSRRMIREEIARTDNRLRQREFYRKHQPNRNLTDDITEPNKDILEVRSQKSEVIYQKSEPEGIQDKNPPPPEGGAVRKPRKPRNESFKTWTLEQFDAECQTANVPQILNTDELDDFKRYWTEPDANGKMRLALNKTWLTKGRMRTWSKNNSNGGRFYSAKGTILRTNANQHRDDKAAREFPEDNTHAPLL